MSTLQAIPTQHGMDILNSELKNTATRYRLVGAPTQGAPNEDLAPFYEDDVETCYYDDNGVLTFIVNLPIEKHLDSYLYRIDIIDNNQKSVIECITPTFSLAKGIGGMVTLKAALSGQAGEIIFKHSEFVTETELVELHLAKYVPKDSAQFLPYDPQRIYSVGEICYTKEESTGELSYWLWYSNVESLKGKNPLDTVNRHLGWTATDKPFYWVPYTGDQVGMPFYWLDTSAPEWAVMEINADLHIAVYWRLARRYPELVFERDGVDFINTGEIRGEFLRVLDQGRGIDSGREIRTYQAGTKIAGEVGDLKSMNTHTIHDIRDIYGDPIYETNFDMSVQYDIETAFQRRTGPHAGWWRTTRPRNVARPMAIAI